MSGLMMEGLEEKEYKDYDKFIEIEFPNCNTERDKKNCIS